MEGVIYFVLGFIVPAIGVAFGLWSWRDLSGSSFRRQLLYSELLRPDRWHGLWVLWLASCHLGVPTRSQLLQSRVLRRYKWNPLSWQTAGRLHLAFND